MFLLQREPESASEMPMFLEEAKQVVDKGGSPHDGDFSKLRWSPDGALLTSGDQMINCTVVNSEHDNYGSGGTSYLTTYCLTVQGTKESKTFVVEMSLRN